MKRLFPVAMLVLAVFTFLSACKKEEDKVKREVKTLEAVDITSNSAVLHGQNLVESQTNRISMGFCWSRLPNPDLSDSIAQCMDDEFQKTLSNLNSSTKYYYRAYVVDVDGTVYGEERSFTTLAAPAMPVLEFKQSNGYTYANQTVNVDTPILVGVMAQSADAPLSRFTVRLLAFFTQTVVDTSFTSSNFNMDLAFAFSGVGEAELVFTIWDANNKKTSKSLVFTVEATTQETNVKKQSGVSLVSCDMLGLSAKR